MQVIDNIIAVIVVLSSVVIVSGILYDTFAKRSSVTRSGFFTGTCQQPPDPILRGPYPASPSWDGLADTSEAALLEYSLKYNPALGSY